VATLAPVVNELARYVPPRRARKLHIGLFGYSRELDGHDVHLPRAIRFCCAMYSLGIPPEVLGLGALSREDLVALREAYVNFDRDMQDAMRYLNPDILERLSSPVRDELSWAVELFPTEPDEEHRARTSRIWALLQEGENNRSLIAEEIVKAAARRRFLG
jgi:phosphoenolpyruvate carboxylase